MVRAHMKQTSDEKKESSSASEKKRVVSKQKKNSETGIWPCKINGCNKEFAREADLKRHQRTTKLHSQPGSNVACPQCEATFTRIDALRRHQKSRHNGVILEPINSAQQEGTAGEDGGSHASASRDGTPSNGMGSSTSIIVPTTATVTTMLTRTDTSGATSGPTSYYRSHTINPVFVPPRTPHGILDTSFQVTQLPTSATRLHGTSWPPAPPWVQENPNFSRTGSGSIPYAPHATPYYPPGSYYRTPTGTPSAPPISVSVPSSIAVAAGQQQAAALREQDGYNAQSLSPRASPSVPASNIDPSLAEPQPLGSSSAVDSGQASQQPAPDATSLADHAGISAAVQKAIQAVLAIDPDLKNAAPAIITNGEFSESNDNTSSVQAAETSANSNSNENNGFGAPSATSQGTTDANGITAKEKDTDMDVDADGEADPDGEDDASQDSNQLVTEENVPMLRPDELLVEESLASPPPS